MPKKLDKKDMDQKSRKSDFEDDKRDPFIEKRKKKIPGEIDVPKRD